jgi:hypothetical protein
MTGPPARIATVTTTARIAAAGDRDATAISPRTAIIAEGRKLAATDRAASAADADQPA